MANRLTPPPPMNFARQILVGVLLLALCPTSYAADINAAAYITCISEDSASKAKLVEYQGEQRAAKIRVWFAHWLFGDNANTLKSKVDFRWQPRTEHGPQVDIITTEKLHNLITVRAKTTRSAIIVSSASNQMTTESWTFTLNFALESVVATRVQTNLAGVRGEVLLYRCVFDPLVDAAATSTPLG